ncbi:maleate cis-trans isomerase family protein [Phaeobacter marinintestinus]|uniref:maleate cis-trans isomerase family protein n=1 Tax=Falsiphaeobacter marinintestinus TaxID=1492905 RepID=UPI0011B712F1|nr:aspartate/glutamate racemase family protein [Phaeobacter marinintestinus]
MQVFAHDVVPATEHAAGLIALQTDERIESDMRRLLPPDMPLFVSRVPSAPEVTRETLAQMEGHLTGAATLLPPSARFSVIGYGCTSGSAQIGTDTVADRVREGANTRGVTNPVSALLAACAALGIRRLALLSPYVAAVSDQLRTVLAENGVQTPVFGSFDVSQEARVIRIAPASIIDAAETLMRSGDADAVFLSCTNLNTLDTIAELEDRTGLPVLSSNLVLAWHMARLAGRQVTFESCLTRAWRPDLEGSAA